MKEVKELVKLTNKDKVSLKHNYASALKNDDFKDLLSSYKIKEDVALKYTSNLMDASIECANCKKCKSLLECKNSLTGFCYTPKLIDEKIDFSYVSCKYKNNELKDTNYLKYVYLFDIPRDIKYASLKNVYTDDKMRVPIIKYFKKFIDEYDVNKNDIKGLYLNGSFGSGKTYLVAALFNELAKKEIDSAIIYFPEFLRKLKSSFSSDLYEDRFEYIKKVPLLLIDDIGAENLSNWGRDEILGPILQYRMEEHLPTFLTSNFTLEELEEHLASTNGKVDKVKARRIIERIKELTVDMKLISKNRRSN